MTFWRTWWVFGNIFTIRPRQAVSLSLYAKLNAQYIISVTLGLTVKTIHYLPVVVQEGRAEPGGKAEPDLQED